MALYLINKLHANYAKGELQQRLIFISTIITCCSYQLSQHCQSNGKQKHGKSLPLRHNQVPSITSLPSVSLPFSLCHSNSRRKEQLSNDVSTQRGGLDVRQRAITNALISIILCWRTVSSLAATGWISRSCVQLVSGAFPTWTNVGFCFLILGQVQFIGLLSRGYYSLKEGSHKQ